MSGKITGLGRKRGGERIDRGREKEAEREKEREREKGSSLSS